ncbi:hypothetical protein OH738_10720 [Streptomyces hirsutus]|uniref:Uncharacterized protein n=1 Tax=Streptomyces hirsutus TaxID=35620 RepID=A0ABZ1GX11_9ACTN|nr:hypothetical protein [Streptomyces hirsutus]WSD09338.1 hypothetical protein OIE73_28755 [Streptomyces hirsutus]WTD17212.1 hypothetical protein OH738_10720 [Streptomyces hirsutus]
MEYHQHVPPYPTLPPTTPGSRRPWWKQPIMLLPTGLAAVSVAFFIGVAVGQSQSDADTLPLPATQTQNNQPSAQPQDNQPAGLTSQEKHRILFKFCTSSKMSGPVEDSTAFPTCMGDYYVTDQGMVMPR